MKHGAQRSTRGTIRVSRAFHATISHILSQLLAVDAWPLFKRSSFSERPILRRLPC